MERFPNSLTGSEPRTYNPKPLDRPKFFLSLAATTLSVPLLVSIQALRLYYRTGSFYWFWYLHHLGPILFPFLMSIAIAVYAVIFRFKILNSKIETSQEGIRRIERNGLNIFIPWKQLGAVSGTGSAGVTLKDQTGKMKITISNLYEDFEDLRKIIYTEFENNRSGSNDQGQIYAMPPSVKLAFLFGGLLLLILTLGAFGSAIASFQGLIPSHISNSAMTVLMTFCGMVFLVPTIYYLGWGPKISQSKIRISSNGIERIEKDGTSVYIQWGEMTRLVKRERMKQLGIYTSDPAKKIMVDYQFDGFERIKDTVSEEYQKRFKAPILPVTFGRLPVLPNLGILSFFAFYIGLMFWIFLTTKADQPGAFWTIIAISLGTYLLIFFADSKQVKAIVLDRSGVILYQLFKKTNLVWADIAKVAREPKTARGGTYYELFLLDNAGKKHVISFWLDSNSEVYFTLKKCIENPA